jgi:cell division protein FtsN
VSFILDALKKLEREKQSREPGVVMVGQVPWGGADRRRSGRLFGAAAAALILVLAVGLWWLSVAPRTPAPTEDREDALPDRDSSARAVSSPAGEPVPPPAPSRPPAEEAPASRSMETPGSVPAPAVPPTPRPLDLPLMETTAASAGSDWAPDEVEPVAPGPSSPATDAETSPPSAPAPDFRLSAISTRDGEPIALLNDRLVHEGDSFDGVRIIRIGETEVEIEVDGKRRTIGF